ncbi:MAG: PEP-CTERM sorting domain-containing protein [Tepidisphaeraceae bacterium]
MAQAGITAVGEPDVDRAAGAAMPTVLIETFTGVSAGAQNLVRGGDANLVVPGSTAYVSGSFGVADPAGGGAAALMFGNVNARTDKIYETINTATPPTPPIAKPGKLYFLTTTDNATAITDSATGYYYPKGAFIAPNGERLAAQVLITPKAPAFTITGAKVIDPYPIVAVSGEDNSNSFNTYAYTAEIGGQDATDPDNINSDDPTTTPTALSVGGTGQVTSMEYFADDSNDPTFNTTQSDPIWDFAISLDTMNGAPELEASFTYDPSRLSFDGPAPTAGELLSDLLADENVLDANNLPEVSYTTDGVDSAAFCINDAIDLFSGTYTALDNANSMDSSISSDIDFSFGDAAAATVPEPASASLLGIGALMLVRRRRAGGTSLE